MILEFKLPPIGEGVESADIAEILIGPGDSITAEQVVMELETEKAVFELTCPYEGAVLELAVSEGDTISIGQTLFKIDAQDKPIDDAVIASDSGEGQATRETTPSSPVPQSAASTESTESPAGGVAVEHSSVEHPSVEHSSVEHSSVEHSSVEHSSVEHSSVEHSSEEPGPDPESEDEPPSANQVDVVLPNIGEGVESAEIAEIHVSVGDTVDRNEIVMDLETEKAVVELPSDRAGTVTHVHVSVGDTVEVGQRLLTLQSVETTSELKPDQAVTRDAPVAAPAIKQTSEAGPSSVSVATQTTAVTSVTELVKSDGNGRVPVPAAPSTRRLARQLGVDLQLIAGSGPGGRITQDDVQEFVRSRLQTGLPAIREGGGVPSLAPGSLAPPPLPDFSKFGPVEREKLSRLGRTVAENLTVSWNVIPHVTQHDRADMTELESARKRFALGAGADGPKITMTAIVMKALATCLQQFPKFNSSLDPETNEIVYKRYYHIGCAVDTPSGLLVPVVRDCDQKSIREVAREIGELAGLARERKLPMDAMQGATCTVTNLGGIGGTSFTPIVNYPEVCILGLARGQKELRLEEGEISERLMLPLSLSYDHRVINGADAARFLVTLCKMLSDPFQLLAAI